MRYWRRSLCSRIVLLTFLCTLSGALQVHYDFQHDDAYISYRYASNWARGHGPVYNPGERVEGYSNFLWVAVLAAARRLGLDIVSVSRALGTLSSFAIVVFVYRTMRVILRRSHALALVGSTSLAVHAGLAVWARSGLETVPLTAILLLAQMRFQHAHTRGSCPVGAGFLFGVGALLRADGLLFALPSLLYLIGTRCPRRRVLLFAGTVLLLPLPWFVWRLSYYGYVFPNSYYLKLGGDFFQQLRGLHYTYNFVLPFGGALLFVLPLCLVWCRDARRNGARVYLGLHVAIVGLYVVWVGGDHMPMARFYIPIVPAFTILVLEAVVDTGQRLRGLGREQRLRMASVLVATVASAGLLPALNSRRVPSSHAVSCRIFVQQCSLAGNWFRTHVPPGTLLATAPAGAVAFFSELPVVDMLGVNDLHIAHLEVPNMGHGSAGHEKRDLTYVLSRQPAIIFRGVSDTRRDPSGRDCEPPFAVRTYADGSRFRLHSEPLGPGPCADDYGTVRTAELFLEFEALEPAMGGATSTAANER